MAEERGNAFGSDFDNFMETDYRPVEAEYKNAVDAYRDNPTEANKAAVDRALAKLDAAAHEALKKAVKAKGIDEKFVDDKNFDPSKPFDAAGQPNMSPENVKSMENFRAAVEDVAGRQEKRLDFDKLYKQVVANGDLSKLTFDKTKGTFVVDEAFRNLVTDIYEGNGKYKSGFQKFKDMMTRENFMLLLKLALLGGAIYGAIYLKNLLNGILCNLAQQSSGCMWYAPNNAGQDVVAYNGNVPSVCGYSYCCGDCDSATLQSVCAGTACCGSQVDADSGGAHKDPNGRYSYKCESIWSTLVKAIAAIGDGLDPSKWLGVLKTIAIYAAIAIGGALVLYIIYKLIASYRGSWGKKGGGGGSSGSPVTINVRGAGGGPKIRR